MRALLRLVIYLILFLPFSLLKADPLIRLVVPDFKPYSYQLNNEILGYGVEPVIRALELMQVPYTLSIVPNYGRALAELKQNRADAFFMASENEERSEVARFSGPIMMNRWSWFLNDPSLDPKRNSFKEIARIATVLNSNTHRWLIVNGFRVAFTGTDIQQLIDLLDKGRVDAVLVAELVFKDALKNSGRHRKFREFIHSERDFGVYFSKAFLKRNVGFLERFNTVVNSAK